MVHISPVHEDFVAEATGFSVVDSLSDDVFQQIKAALDQHAVLILPDQPVTEEQQLDFARRFGPLETSVGASVYNADTPRRLAKPELSDISNLDDKGTILPNSDVRRLINLSNRLWHTDSSFKRTPASVSMLAAQEVPPIGGATEFADMRAAWDALPEDRRKALDGLVAEHDYFHSRSLTGFDVGAIPIEWRERQPSVPQVLVRTHPATNRKSLYLASHIKTIVGMPQEEAQALLDELMAFATQPQFVYRHRWRTNDIVIWDNRCTMHRGREFDERYRRSMRRATVQDVGPTVAAM